jgi:hypothetical protein
MSRWLFWRPPNFDSGTLLHDALERWDEAGAELVAVGALHLVGPTGLLSLLCEAGYRVEEPLRAE